MNQEEQFSQIINKIQELKKGKNPLDLSSKEDLAIGIMNLISLEEHFFFTYNKTKDSKYLDLLNQTREVRKNLLKEIVKNPEGENWCVPPNTNIYTNPAAKTINKITEGEKVLTANGKFSAISKIFKRNYSGEMVLIKSYYCDDLFITPEHPVLCATDVREKQKDLWRKKFRKPKIIWKMAKDLKNTDFLLFPRYKRSKDLKKIKWEYKWINKGCFRLKGGIKPKKFSNSIEIKVDKNLMRLIGLYLSEGSTSENRYSYRGIQKHSFNLYFSFGKHEADLINETKKLFEKVFGRQLKSQETHTSFDLVCSKRVIVDFFSQFGRNSSEKHLPFWIIDLPNEKLVHLIWGLIKGDGGERKYNVDYFTISEKLAHQVRLILFKLGMIHSLKRREIKDGGKIDGRIIRSNYPGFSIRISGDAARILHEKIGLKYKAKRTSGNFGYVLDKYIMIPIRRIEKISYSGKVYNLEVPGEESYTTCAGVVHNCISKHLLATSMRLMEVGTKQLSDGDKNKAEELFKKSYTLWNIFWGLNLGLIEVKDIKEKDDDPEQKESKKKLSVWSKLGEIIQEVLDCCKE